MKNFLQKEFKDFNLESDEFEIIENIIKRRILETKWYLLERWQKFGSPIERKLYIALNYLKISKDGHYTIFKQKPFTFNNNKTYTADFYIYQKLEAGMELKLIVECDGHDFHEKTKEQAQKDKERDRMFTINGFFIMRFTGRDINKDVIKCAEEIHEFADQKYGESVTLDLKLHGEI